MPSAESNCHDFKCVVFCFSEFCMKFHFHANQSHFHKNGFALRLVLKQRPKATGKLPIKSCTA